MVTFVKARDELYRRLCAVGPSFEELYPGVQAPKVIKGAPASEPPFYIAVSDVAALASTSGQATTGDGRWEFTLEVMCFAQHASQECAADTLMTYVDAVFNAVMADQRLRGTVDNSFPSVQSVGTSPDSSKRHLAAASVAVRCSVFSACPKRFREVVS